MSAMPAPQQAVTAQRPAATAQPSPPVLATTPPQRLPPRDPHAPKEPEKLASIDPKSLIGLEPGAVQTLLGAPSSVHKGEPTLIWSYDRPGCSFRVIFYPDLKTTSFHALKYIGVDRNGGAIDSSQSCIRDILTARDNGPA
jgi:hypothetical protein